MELDEGDYELDGHWIGNFSGIAKDGTLVILESGDSTGAVTVRHQDVASPRGDRIYFGRDYLTPPERELTIYVDTADRGALDRLRTIWRADAVRTTPGARSVLRWRHGGVSYRAYGRARDFQVTPQKRFNPDYAIVQASFQYSDAVAYLDATSRFELGKYALPAGGECLTLPAVLPWTLGAAPTSVTGVIAVSGTTPTPFQIEIRGPISGSATGIRLWGAGWELDFGTLTLKPGQTLLVDTGRGVALRDGINVAGALSARSTLLGRIAPGANTFHMTVVDATATTTAVVSWHDAAAIF